MKKALVIFALALFIGGISAPAIANNSNALTMISIQDDDPKKKKAEGEKKAEKSKEATKKSGDCSSEAKPAKSSGGCEK